MTPVQRPADPFPPPVGDQPPPPRAIGRFASFALAMSTICVLAGGITSFPTGYCSVGGAAVGLGWPLCALFSLAVALTLGQVASAFPRAGGPCEWAAELGGRGWGWAAGCFNLAALVTVLAAINVGLCQFALSSPARILGYDPAALPSWVLKAAVLLVTLVQAAINHYGVRFTTRLTSLGGYLIVGTVVALTGLLLVCALASPAGVDPARLVTFSNYSGPAGGDTWPATGSVAWLFALGLLMPAYTITGFDAPAQTAEETADPEVNVPRAMWQAVLLSGVAGWLMLSAVVLAAPDPDAAAAAGQQSFFQIVRAATPRWTHGPLYTAVALSQFVCGLACVTAASRLAWAMARDRGLPFARRLGRLGTHATPAAAVWAVAGVAAGFALLPYSAVASVCAVFFYLAYALPSACGLATYGRWPRVGPWHLGRWYPPLAAACVLGCAGLVVLGVQPPNQLVAWVLGATAVGLLALWFGHFRLRFRDEVTRALRQLPAFRDVEDVTATPLGGGLTNRNYRVEVGGETFVLRVSGAGVEGLLIDRPREMAAVRAAAAAGVAPEVVAHLPDYSVVVTRFAHGRPVTADEARRPDALAWVARALRAYHDHPVPAGLGPFCPYHAARHYYRLAVAKGVPVPPDLGPAVELADRLEAAAGPAADPRLCHNDLLLGNFIAVGDGVRVLDWEYAGLGDPMFDLGNFAAHAQLDEAGERALLLAYRGEVTDADLRRLRLMRLASDLREAAWGFLQAGVSALHPPAYYLDYGHRHLDRFLLGAAALGLDPA
jgi:amino acid transporter/thiamine kinase-like enzyme